MTGTYNKYYTPSIEEFHVGFEGEFFNNMTDRKWNPEICNEDTLQIVFDAFEHGTEEDGDTIDKVFRVKYLDKEDIESLGFEYNKTQPGLNEDYFEHPSEYFMDYDYDSKYCRIYYSIEGGDSTIFAGIISNKSELKRLLKQLGI